MKRSFTQMPDEARLWVFASAEPLDERQEEWLRSHVDAFVSGWVAHGAPVMGASELREHRFLFVAADEAATGVSGCSIDALTRTLKEAERTLGASLLDAASKVWYRDQVGNIETLSRAEFGEQVRTGRIDDEAIVFDNTAATVGALRNGLWERPMNESWHGRAFQKQQS